MMKKVLALLLSCVMLASVVVGCGSNETEAPTEDAKVEESADAEGSGSNLDESKALLEEAIATLMTTDNQQMMPEGNVLEVPEAAGTPEELEALDDTNIDKWHYMEYLDWDSSQDVEFPVSPADGQKGKHVILIVHGAHAWTTCYTESFEAACEAVGMTCDIYDPNWDQSTQDGYIDQAINEQPDAIVLIPISADHAAQQFKKITDAGIPAFCSNGVPEASAMNYIISYTGPNDWIEMRLVASALGETLNGEGGVCYITHNVGSAAYYARTFAPMSTLATEYPNLKHLDVQSPGFEATAVKQVVSDWITKYGDELNAIVLADDSDQAVGAVEACKAAGRDDIVIVSNGISKQGAEFIQSGDLKMITYHPCQSDAGLAVRTVSEWFCGEEIPRVSYLETEVITADNVESYLPCQW